MTVTNSKVLPERPPTNSEYPSPPPPVAPDSHVLPMHFPNPNQGAALHQLLSAHYQHQPIVIQLQTSEQDRLHREYEKRRIQKEKNQFAVTLLFALGFLFPPLWILSCVHAFRPRRNNVVTRSIGVSAFVLFVILALLVITAVIVSIAVPVTIYKRRYDYYGY